MSLTEAELALLDEASTKVQAKSAASSGGKTTKKKKKRPAVIADEEAPQDVAEAAEEGEANDIEARLPTHSAAGEKLKGPRARRIEYLQQLTDGQIRGITKFSVAKLDEKILEVEEQLMQMADCEAGEAGEGDEGEEVGEDEAGELAAPKFTEEELLEGSKFIAQIAAQGLLVVEKVTHSTAGQTGVDCEGAYQIYCNNPVFQKNAEKGWEKLLRTNPTLVQKICGPYFYLANAYGGPCALAATENLRRAKREVMKE